MNISYIQMSMKGELYGIFTPGANGEAFFITSEIVFVPVTSAIVELLAVAVIKIKEPPDLIVMARSRVVRFEAVRDFVLPASDLSSAARTVALADRGKVILVALATREEERTAFADLVVPVESEMLRLAWPDFFRQRAEIRYK